MGAAARRLATGQAVGYGSPVSAPVRVVVGEDDVLMREGIVRLLTDAGFDVVAHAGDADSVLRRALAHRPDVVVTDVQMPPRNEDDGLQAALELRRQRPEVGVLVLSQHFEEHYALNLIGDRPEGVGYLLKERVGDVDVFIEAVARVAAGGSALDPVVVGRMLGRSRADGPLDELTPREREVLAAMAEGKSNRGIADELVITEAAVEKHVTRIFHKLDLGATPNEHRRVLAVLTYLRGSSS
jgi:DNA-binding NarL/FixJ family response regulator